MKRPRQWAEVCEVLEDGTLSLHDGYDWREETITLKAAVQRLMDEIAERNEADAGKAYLAKSLDPRILPGFPCDVRFESVKSLPRRGVIEGLPKVLYPGDVLFIPLERRWIAVYVLR
jgi:hypothetical protein